MAKVLNLTESQLHQVVMEAAKQILKEHGDFLYGVNPEGDDSLGMEQNIEGADIRINNAGTIHVEKCTKAGNVYTAVDNEGHRICIPVDKVEELMNGDKVNASLETEDGEEYEVFISIEHPSEFQKFEKFMKDRETDPDHAIFGSSKIGD